MPRRIKDEREEQFLLDEERRRVTERRIAALGELLGFHKSFIEDVAARGQEAVIDRVAITDQTGAQSRLLALTQVLGSYIEGRMERGIWPGPEELLEVVADLAQQFEIQPLEAVELLDPVLEIYRGAARVLGRRQEPDETNTV